MARRGNTPRRGPFNRLGELFDASALGLVTLLLLGASFFATWRGMRDFIIGNDLASGMASQGLVIAIVLALTLAMYVTLREMIAPYHLNGIWPAIWKRLVALPLYLLLAVWSIGFGYGFWWSIIAGQGVTDTELTRSVTALREQTSDIRSRIAAAGSVMASAEALSDQKARNEAERGGTCGVASPPGDGPLARARGETQSQIAAISATVRGDWLPSITARLDRLDTDLDTVRTSPRDDDLTARKAAFDRVYSSARLSAREISTDAAARGRSLATQLRAKASQLSEAPEAGRVTYCYDPDLATSLTAAADEIDQPFDVTVPDFRFSEGPEGVARAVEDLWGYVLAPAGLEVAGARSGPPNGRSLIALVATIGVDFALLVFALLRGRDFGYTPNGSNEPGVIDVGPISEARSTTQITGVDRAAALPAPEEIEQAAPRLLPREGNIRKEARPEAVGIRTYAPGSQVEASEQVEDLIRDIDDIYKVMSSEQQLELKDAEIARLQKELDELKRRGYVATGREGQVFDPKLHREVGSQPSDQPPGTIIATIRPGFITDGLNVYRIAQVIVSSGPSKLKF
ncbi:MAG: nucleotide exchange factor GrpE [Pseudomonadota bacterium]